MCARLQHGHMREYWLVPNPFTEREGLQVRRSGVFLCSTDVGSTGHPLMSYIVEANNCQSYNCTESLVGGNRPVYCVCDSTGASLGVWSTRPREAIWIPNHVRELQEKCFYECQSLCCVKFGASSKLRRICAPAHISHECRCAWHLPMS